MIDNTKKKFWLFTVIYAVMMLLVLIVSIEILLYLFSKADRIRLASMDEIVSASKMGTQQTKAQIPNYIPHPYFGYVYTPNNTFKEGNYVANSNDLMKSNADGFIDEEFPHEKSEGVCVYGILGGSAAMSWGCAKREDRLSYKLEKLLNTHLKTNKCREYRVLNMGIGSHIQYQATQVFLYYNHLLDGVIFYNGFNECAHGAMLSNSEPVQFPVINVYAALATPMPLTVKILEMRRELSRLATFLLNHSYLIHLHSVRFLFNFKGNKLEKLHNRLQQEGHNTALPGFKGQYKEGLRHRFPNVTPESFLHSYEKDSSDIPKLLEEILPLVYTKPTLHAYAAARTTNTSFLSVIQPMIYATGKGQDWKTRRIATYHFQNTCVDKLSEEAKILETYGIKTHNINKENIIGKELFWSQVHIKPEGNDIAARYLFELIKKEWHK